MHTNIKCFLLWLNSIGYEIIEILSIVCKLGALWVCIVLNPRATQMEKSYWRELLEKWSKHEHCPQEDPDFRPPPPPPRDAVCFV